jgi:hypothetical protein
LNLGRDVRKRNEDVLVIMIAADGLFALIGKTIVDDGDAILILLRSVRDDAGDRDG